jgi:hypothetical protein
MADIFLSYASEDVNVARSLAAWLEDSGWSVWWDRKIFAGKVFDTVITRELNAARCVLVLWTRHSVASNWVKDEATEAADRQILVPVVLDEAPIPMGFRRIQAARLVGWAGDVSDSRLKDLRDAVLECAPVVTTTLVDAPKPQRPPKQLIEQAVAATSKPPGTRAGWMWLVLVGIASVVIGWIAFLLVHDNARSLAAALLAWVFVAVICMFPGYRFWRKARKGADALPDQAVAKPLRPRDTRLDWVGLPLIAIASIAIGYGVAIALSTTGVRGDAILFAAWGLVAVILMFVGYRIWRKSRKVADVELRHRAER